MTAIDLGTPQARPRRRSRQVRVGAVAVGGGAPVSVQSMTTTVTADVEATLRQIAEALERAAKGDDLTGVRRLYGLFAQEVRRVAEQAGVAAD